MTTQFAPSERFHYLMQYGPHCLAYSTLQPGMSYFDLPEIGYIAYKRYWGTTFVLSDPICSDANLPELMSAFLAEHRDVFFAQIHDRTARVLQDGHGFLVNSFGVENSLDPSDFPISWNVRRDLKRWLSALSKNNIEVREEQGTLCSSEAERVSAEWISTKPVKREMVFLARPFSTAPEPGTRRFFAFFNSRLTAFCTFDPCYFRGGIVGHALNHMRAAKGSPNGILDVTIIQAVRKFASEGIRNVNLGVSPLHERDTSRFRGARIADLVADFLYRRASRFYRFKELGFHKDRYRPRKEQVYLASRKRYSLMHLIKLFRVNRVL